METKMKVQNPNAPGYWAGVKGRAAAAHFVGNYHCAQAQGGGVTRDTLEDYLYISMDFFDLNAAEIQAFREECMAWAEMTAYPDADLLEQLFSEMDGSD